VKFFDVSNKHFTFLMGELTSTSCNTHNFKSSKEESESNGCWGAAFATIGPLGDGIEIDRLENHTSMP
jgi:hypothetical protein